MTHTNIYINNRMSSKKEKKIEADIAEAKAEK
jgi:hypothetical protein